MEEILMDMVTEVVDIVRTVLMPVVIIHIVLRRSVIHILILLQVMAQQIMFITEQEMEVQVRAEILPVEALQNLII